MRAFDALATELHFGRAAEHIGVSQPALSQMIRKLEDEFGAELVTRSSREVTLTRVGQAFLEGCKRTIAESGRAADSVKDALAGVAGRLMIGTLGAGANGPLPTMIASFRRHVGRATVELHHFPDSATQERQLLDGSLDIALVRSISNLGVIEALPVAEEDFVVFLPRTHRLADRIEVGITELANDPFVLWPRTIGPEYFDSIVHLCTAAGFTPRIEAYGTSLETQLSLVAAGLGVSIQSASHQRISREGTVCRTLTGTHDMVVLWLAYRHRHTRLVDEFIRGARHGQPV